MDTTYDLVCATCGRDDVYVSEDGECENCRDDRLDDALCLEFDDSGWEE